VVPPVTVPYPTIVGWTGKFKINENLRCTIVPRRLKLNKVRYLIKKRRRRINIIRRASKECDGLQKKDGTFLKRNDMSVGYYWPKKDRYRSPSHVGFRDVCRTLSGYIEVMKTHRLTSSELHRLKQYLSLLFCLKDLECECARALHKVLLSFLLLNREVFGLNRTYWLKSQYACLNTTEPTHKCMVGRA